MQLTIRLTVLILVVCVATATAQTPVTTSGGNSGNVAVFTGTSDIESSEIVQQNGSIFIYGLPLGAPAGSTTNLLTLHDYNENSNYLTFSQIRQSDGNNGDLDNWLTATTRISATTDVSLQGYMDFNPNGDWW